MSSKSVLNNILLSNCLDLKTSRKSKTVQILHLFIWSSHQPAKTNQQGKKQTKNLYQDSSYRQSLKHSIKSRNLLIPSNFRTVPVVTVFWQLKCLQVARTDETLWWMLKMELMALLLEH